MGRADRETAGEPADTHAVMGAAVDFATTSAVTKLLVIAPGTPIVTTGVLHRCTDYLPNLSVTDVGGPAGHFLLEDRPGEIAGAVWDWLSALR